MQTKKKREGDGDVEESFVSGEGGSTGGFIPGPVDEDHVVGRVSSQVHVGEVD